MRRIVVSYNSQRLLRQFRNACASDTSRLWNFIDANMWQLTMTGKVRPACSACHLVHPLAGSGRCPFRPFGDQAFRPFGDQAFASHAQPSRGSFWEVISKGGREICRNYNYRRCTSNQCPRAHVCLLCKGSHPSISCFSESATQRAKNVTVGQQS